MDVNSIDRRLQRLLLDWQATPQGLETSQRCVESIVEAVLVGVEGLGTQTEALRSECSSLDAELRRLVRSGQAIDEGLFARRITVAHLIEAFGPLGDDDGLGAALRLAA